MSLQDLDCWLSLLTFLSVMGSMTNNSGWGLQKPSIHLRVINGVTVNSADFPYLGLIINRAMGRFCGGTVITENLVLTAAHCLQKSSCTLIEPMEIEFYLGNISLIGQNVQSLHSFHIRKLLWHRDFSNSKKDFVNDIALLLLDGTIANVTGVSLVRTRNDYNVKEGSCQVVGWGFDESQNPSSDLKKTTVPMRSKAYCAKRFKFYNHSRQFCALGKQCQDGMCSDSCTGDSGGPFLCQTKPNPEVLAQVGIVSFGPKKCGHSDQPGFYIRITAFSAWIEEHARNYSKLAINFV